jgi:hypothetical protein
MVLFFLLLHDWKIIASLYTGLSLHEPNQHEGVQHRLIGRSILQRFHKGLLKRGDISVEDCDSRCQSKQ